MLKSNDFMTQFKEFAYVLSWSILLGVLLIHPASSRAQAVDWLTIFDENTITGNIDLYENGDILVSGVHLATEQSFISRVAKNGDQLWYRDLSIPENPHIRVTAFVNPDNSIILYDRHGSFSIVDSTGVDTLIHEQYSLSDYEITSIYSIKQIDDKNLIVGQAKNDSVNVNFFLLHNPESNQVSRQSITLNGTTPLLPFRSVDIDSSQHALLTVYQRVQRILAISYLDENNNQIWTDSLYLPNLSSVRVSILNNNRFYITGSVYQQPGIHLGYISCFSLTNSNLIWETYFHPENNEDYSNIHSVISFSDDKLLCAGNIGSTASSPSVDIQYALLDMDGNKLWQRREDIGDKWDDISALKLVDNESAIIAGTMDNVDGSPRYEQSFLMKIDLQYVGVKKADKQTDIKVYPNPAGASLFINMPNSLHEPTYQIYNLSGQSVLSGKMVSDEISIVHLPIGSYILNIRTDEWEENIQFIKSR